MHVPTLARRSALAGLLATVVLGSGASPAAAQVALPCIPVLDPAGCQPPPQPSPVPPPAPAPGPAPVDPRGVDPASPNPLVGLPWYTDRVWGLPARAARAYAKRGQNGRAALMAKIAQQPQFRWFGAWVSKEPGGAAGSVRRYLERVQSEQPGTVPQIALMRHAGERCSPRYRAGGAREDARTRAWWDDVARGIGNARVVVAFEPDSLGTIHCLARSRRDDRIRLLRYGVDVMSKLPNATVYVEAGASDWQPAWLMARKLRAVGVEKVRGFMLNVTHYDWTASNIRYGRAISRRVGGKHFVINTAQNGRGAVHRRQRVGKQTKRIFVRCPLRRGLGRAPTTQTPDPLIDAFLYIGRVGVSGAYCKDGPKTVGGWHPERALMFARYATDWLRPPKGTRFGLRKRLPARKLTGAEARFR
jgi:endoglucanase